MRCTLHGANATLGGGYSFSFALVPLDEQPRPKPLRCSRGWWFDSEQYVQLGGCMADVKKGRWRLEVRSYTHSLTSLHTMQLGDARLHPVALPYAVYETPEIYTAWLRTVDINKKFPPRDSITVLLFGSKRLQLPVTLPGVEGSGLWLDPSAGIFYVPPPAQFETRYWIYEPIRGYLQVLELCHRCPTPRWALGSFEKVLR